MNETDRSALEQVAASLTTAWNASDGSAFAASFTPDADFVNIFGMHLTGRDAIAKQHQMIFESIYRGSRVLFTVKAARQLHDGVLVAQIGSVLQNSGGPMAGEMKTLATAVFVREGPGWRIASFQNTREQAPPGLS